MKEVIARTMVFVKEKFSGAEGGHDWEHTHRVWIHAKNICQENPNLNRLVVELAALLHDVADHKFSGAGEEEAVKSYLMSLPIDPAYKDQVWIIIQHISYSKKNTPQELVTPEGLAVQDADRLDAMGAIGIARAFNYGGYAGRPIYRSKPAEISSGIMDAVSDSTIHHFYKKLLLLKESMNTPYGQRMAEDRHQFMENFLKQFYQETDLRSDQP